jgi:hypothetical protein
VSRLRELESVVDCVITRERCPPLGRSHAVQVEALAGDYRYSVVNEPGCPRRVSSKICGAERDRTDDLRLAKPALSQLSYGPLLRSGPGQS